MPKKVWRFIELTRLIEPDDRVLVACSGGPDSLCLLDILHGLSKSHPFSLGVIHVDHRQFSRSGQALEAVRRRCRSMGLRFHPVVAKKEDLVKGANEVQCRVFRYSAMEAEAKASGYQRIATGHTQSDQAETILMRIIRGTGSFGLQGILPERDRFIRPLLCCDKGEVLGHLRLRRLRPFEDPSNAKDLFLRNRIRRRLLPMIRIIANPNVDQALLRLSESASRDEDYFEQALGSLLPAARTDGAVMVPLSRIRTLHPALLTRLLVRMMRQIASPGATLEQFRFEPLIQKLHGTTSRRSWSIDWPQGCQVGVEGDSLFLRKSHVQAREFCLEVAQPGDVLLPDGKQRLRFALRKEWSAQVRDSEHVVFDADLVSFPLTVRSLRPGDRIDLWGGAGRHKVSRLLMDAKIPKRLRCGVPLVVQGGEILWIAGLRRSQAAPISSKTKRVLSVELLGLSPLGP